MRLRRRLAAVIVQAARQAVGQVQNEETTFQVMENIQNCAAEMSTGGAVPDWDLVQKRARQSEPKCAADVPLLCNFVQKYGGGIQGTYIKEINWHQLGIFYVDSHEW